MLPRPNLRFHRLAVVVAGLLLTSAGTARADVINFTGSRSGTDPVSFAGTMEVTSTGSTSALLKITLDNTTSSGDAVNFGFITGCTGSIGDRVWNDANQNGVQDAGEAGLPGVAVRLLKDGSPFATTTTDANGHYTFNGLCPGNYTVDVDTPAGFAASPTGGTPDTTLDSDASGVQVALGLNETNPTLGFGF